MLRYPLKRTINTISLLLPFGGLIDSLSHLLASSIALLPALPPVPKPPPLGAIRLNQNAQPATLIEPVNSLPWTGKPDGGVGQRHGVFDDPLEAG